jgi:putative transposase
MMQALGRRYVACFNARYLRTGTLWEGRFKAALVDSERYVLACYRYIELNPVRAGMVRQVSDYRWSSYHANALGQTEARLRPHPTYLSLGTHPDARRPANRDLVDAGLSPHDAEALTLSHPAAETVGQ